MKEDIICDSSSIISLTDSCLIDVFYFLAGKFKGKFIIPRSVEDECVNRPIKMRSHAISAIRIKKAVSDGVLEVWDGDLQERAQEIASLANSSFFVGNKLLHLVHEGEAQMLACALEAGTRNILMDERTTRMLCEEPHALAGHFEDEFGKGVRMEQGKLGKLHRLFGEVSFIRSTELAAVAQEKGYFRHFGEMEGRALEASLYALKFAGAAVSFGEIEGFVKGSEGKELRQARLK